VNEYKDRHGSARSGRIRMTRKERREQLVDIGRVLFADKGFDATSVEEIAAKAEVSKPVVYEHFGGKEGLYAVVVDRETSRLSGMIADALTGGGHPRILLEQAAFALLNYIEEHTDGFRILVRDSPATQPIGTFASLISDVTTQVEHLLVNQFEIFDIDREYAPMYAQMLTGMTAMIGQWWLDERTPSKSEVAAHLVNMAWHGLSRLEKHPTLVTKQP
jgi:AcrR family transcriptional regulator